MRLPAAGPALGLNQEAIAETYRRLTAFFRHHLPRAGRNDVEDLVHDTLLAFMAATSGVKGRFIDRPIPFLLAIARHKLADALERRYRRRESSLDDVPDDILEKVTAAEAAQERSDAMQSDQLRRALDRLQPVERRLLVMRFLDELEHDEVCRLLRIPPDDGSRLKHRALAKLRTRLTPLDPPGAAPRRQG